MINQPTGFEQGIDVEGEVTLASKNSAQPIYWANPPLDVLVKDWSLILNDYIEKARLTFTT